MKREGKNLVALSLAAILGGVFPIHPAGAAEPNQSYGVEIDPPTTPRMFATGTLSNGLRYIIERVPNAPIGMMLVVGAGAHDETPEQANAAHVIEHILVTTFSEDQRVLTQLKANGAIRTLGASTWQKHTLLPIEALPSYDGGPVPMLDVAREWMSASLISDEAVLRERSSVAEEGRGTEATEVPQSLEVQAKVFGSKNLSMLRIGRSGISTLSPEAVREFYAKWYRTDLTTLIVNGDVDVTAWEQAITKEMSKILPQVSPFPRPGRARIDERYLEPHLGLPNRVFFVDRENASHLTVRLYTKAELGRPASVAEELRQSLFSDLTERLIFRLNDTRKLPADVFIISGSTAFDVRVSSIFATARIEPVSSDEGNLSAVLKVTQVMVQQLAQIKEFGATSAEFEFAKQQLRSSIASEPQGVGKRLSRYAELVDQDIIIAMPDRKARIAMLEHITLDEMNDYLRQAINLDRDLDAVVIGPSKRIADPELRQTVRTGIFTGRNQPLGAPRASTYVKRIVEMPPAGKKPVVERIDSDTVVVQLSGGQIVILRRMGPSDGPGNDVIAIGARSANADILRAQATGFFSLTSSFVARPSDLNPDAFAEYRGREGIGSSFELLTDRSTMTLTGPSGSLDSLLQVARIALRSGKEQVDILAGPISFIVPETASARERAQGLQVNREIIQNAVAKALHRFDADALVVSGDFDPVEAASLVCRYLSDLPAIKPGSIVQIDEDRPSLQTAANKSERADVVSDRGTATIRNFSLAFDDTPSARAALAIVVQILNSALFDELRRAGGYDASVKSTIWPDASADGIAILDVSLSYSVDSERSAEFGKLTDSIIASVASGKIDRDRFFLAKQTVIAKARENARDARNFSQMVVQRLLDGQNPRESVKSEADSLAAIGYEQAQGAAIRLFNGGLMTD